MNLCQIYRENIYVPPSPKAIRATIDQVLETAEEKLHKKRQDMIVLDVGSGHGLYSNYLAKNVRKVIGVEPYLSAYKASLKFQRQGKVIMYNVLVEDLKVKEKFDVVVCLTVLEHMPDQEKSLQKIYSLMKKESIMYLTVPNKLWPIENHYGLPFLSWLPLPLANFYMSIMGRGKSYKDSSYSKTYFGLRNLLKKYDWTFNFFLPHPNAFYLGCGYKDLPYLHKHIKNFGIALIRRMPIFWVFSKGFIVYAHKK